MSGSDEEYSDSRGAHSHSYSTQSNDSDDDYGSQRNGYYDDSDGFSQDNGDNDSFDLGAERIQMLMTMCAEASSDSDDEEEGIDEFQKRVVNLSEYCDNSGSYTFDYALFLKIGNPAKMVEMAGREYNEQKRFNAESAKVLEKLQKAGIKFYLYKSANRSMAICLFGASEERLRQEAHRVGYRLALDPDEALQQGTRRGIKIAEHTSLAVLPFDRSLWINKYGLYQMTDTDALYIRYKDEGSRHQDTLFRTVDRLKLTLNLIEADEVVGGCALRLDELVSDADHPAVGFFPLHQHTKNHDIELAWKPYDALFKQPLDKIRNYYGEEVAFYFAWLEFYSRWLILPSAFGLIVFIWQVGAQDADVFGSMLYGLMISIWGTCMLEFWKRKQFELSLRWGTSKWTHPIEHRAAFTGEAVPSMVTGRDVLVYPWTKRLLKTFVSVTVILFGCGAAVGIMIGVMVYNNDNTEEANEASSTSLMKSGVILALAIEIFNRFFGWLSEQLTEWENHRTEAEYTDALIVKSFIFKFINCYGALFYIAFIKWHDVGCSGDSCMGELQIALGSILIANIVYVNFLTRIIPWAKERFFDPLIATCFEEDELGMELTQVQEGDKSVPELEFDREEYPSTFDDFDQLAVQYGYSTLFVTAFPLATLLALINNLAESRIDSQKMIDDLRRPHPRATNSIGTWYWIFLILSFCAVCTNSALIVFTSSKNYFTTDADNSKVLVFFIMEHILFALKVFLAALVPDVSGVDRDNRDRQDYLESMLILGNAEDPDNVDITTEITTSFLRSKRAHEDYRKSLFNLDRMPLSLTREYASKLFENKYNRRKQTVRARLDVDDDDIDYDVKGV